MNYVEIVQELNCHIHESNPNNDQKFSHSTDGVTYDAITFGHEQQIIWCSEDDELKYSNGCMVEHVKLLFNKWIESLQSYKFQKPYNKTKIVLAYGGVDEYDELQYLGDDTLFVEVGDGRLSKIDENYGKFKNIIIDIDYDGLMEFDKVYKGEYHVLVKGTSDNQIPLTTGKYESNECTLFPELEMPF